MLQLVQSRPGVLDARGQASIRRLSANAGLDDKQGGDALHCFARDRRGRGVVDVVEFPAYVTPARHLDQRRRAVRRGRPIRLADTGVQAGGEGMKEARGSGRAAPGRGCPCGPASSDSRRPAECPIRTDVRPARPPTAGRSWFFPVPGASAGRVVSSACSTCPARTLAARSPRPRDPAETPTDPPSQQVERSSSTPSRA